MARINRAFAVWEAYYSLRPHTVPVPMFSAGIRAAGSAECLCIMDDGSIVNIKEDKQHLSHSA